MVVAADHPGQSHRRSRKPEGAVSGQTSGEADDLHRLRLSIEWLNRERMILAGEAPSREHARRLPRAAQLGAVSGISPLTEGRQGGRTPFVLVPPLASDRLQPPAPRGSSGPVASLFIMIAVAIAGAIGYQFATVSVSLSEIAQAAPLQALQLTGRQVLVGSSGNTQRRKKAEAGLLGP